MFKVHDMVGFEDQEDKAPVIAIKGDKVLVDFGARWVNCSMEPTLIGCANVVNPKKGQLVQVHGFHGWHKVLAVKGGDVLIDVGRAWYSTDDMEWK